MRTFVVIALVALAAVAGVQARIQDRILAEVGAEATVGAEQMALAEAYLDTSAEAESKIQALVGAAKAGDFEAFKVAFARQYVDAKEHDLAKTNFQINVAAVAELNSKHPDVKHELGQFSDLSYAEFLHQYTGAKPQPNGRSHSFLELEAAVEDDMTDFAEAEQSPADFEVEFTEEGVEVQGLAARNWLKKATAIKNQQQCGSCAHHSAVESYETYAAIAGKGLKTYSVQQLLDCNHISSNHGCSGSDTGGHWTYLHTHGGVLNSNYPYKAKQGTCRKASGPGPKLAAWSYVSGVNSASKSESSIYNALKKGPVVVYVHASNSWMHYHSGIMGPSACSSSTANTNHAVVVYGYGSSNGRGYWLVRNHWSTSWGEKGYIRLAYGHNTCGVVNWAMQAHF